MSKKSNKKDKRKDNKGPRPEGWLRGHEHATQQLKKDSFGREDDRLDETLAPLDVLGSTGPGSTPSLNIDIAADHAQAKEFVEQIDFSDSSSDTEEFVIPENKFSARQLMPKNRTHHRWKMWIAAQMLGVFVGMTFLEYVSVGAPTVKDYAGRVEALEKFVAHQALPFVTPADVDNAIVEYLNAMYVKGCQISTGEKTVAAWMFKHPKFGRLGDDGMPRVWRALRGWRQMAPYRSRDPQRLEVWCALMWALRYLGQPAMALFVAIGLVTYMRPGEVFQLAIEDFLYHDQPWLSSFIVFPWERDGKSKTGDRDNTVRLDAPWFPFLTKAIVHYIGKKRSGPMWDFSYPQFARVFGSAVRLLRIEKVIPYQWRHSGASIDREPVLTDGWQSVSGGTRSASPSSLATDSSGNARAKAPRTLDEVQRRGFWKSPKSVQRYEKSGRLTVSWSKHSANQQAFFIRCRDEVENILMGFPVPIESVPYSDGHK